MNSKKNKSFILIRVLQCGCVNVHAAVEACAHGMFQTGLRFGWQRCCNIHNSLGKCNEVKCHNIPHRSASPQFWQPASAHRCRVCVYVCVWIHWLHLECLFRFCVGWGQWLREEKGEAKASCHGATSIIQPHSLFQQEIQNRSRELSAFVDVPPLFYLPHPFYSLTFSPSVVISFRAFSLVTSESPHLLFSLRLSGDL